MGIRSPKKTARSPPILPADDHCLRSPGMPAGPHHVHRWCDLGIAIDLDELACGAHKVELLGLHDSLQAELAAARRCSVVTLDDIASVRKEGMSSRIDHPAGMVVMQMADDHDVDPGRVLAHGAQGNRRLTALDALDVSVLVSHPLSGAGLDQDVLAGVLDEEQVQAAEQAATLVGVDHPRPQRSGHDPEEAPRIGPEPAGPNDPHSRGAVRPGLGGTRDRVEGLPIGRHRPGGQEPLGRTRPRSKSRW